MSITPDTLSKIQLAGQSIHAARQAMVEAVAQQGQLVASAVIDQPFSSGNDKLFAQWKNLARMAQEVQSIEEQFKTIYETAAGLMPREIQMLVALPHVPRKKGPVRSHVVEDATVKDMTVTPKGIKRGPKRKNSFVKPNVVPPNLATLKGNHAKVLDFHRAHLNRKSWKPMTHAALAEGAGIPAGSVGASIARLKGDGLLLADDKGGYKLA